MADSVEAFNIKPDKYSCIMVKTTDVKFSSDAQFGEKLAKSLCVWKENGIRGVWVKVPIQQASLVPIVTQAGFVFHHAKEDYVMLKQWLTTTEPECLPRYATQSMGCAGFVVNDKNQVLTIQEKFHQQKHWKLPGGLAEPGEDVWEAAAREVFEETGVRAEFEYLVCFRHQHGFHFGNSDLYMICAMRPLTLEIKKCNVEISDACWMDLDEYANHPTLTESNRHIAKCYLASRDRQARLQTTPLLAHNGQSMTHWFHLPNTIEPVGAKDHGGKATDIENNDTKHC